MLLEGKHTHTHTLFLSLSHHSVMFIASQLTSHKQQALTETLDTTEEILSTTVIVPRFCIVSLFDSVHSLESDSIFELYNQYIYTILGCTKLLVIQAELKNLFYQLQKPK